MILAFTGITVVRSKIMTRSAGLAVDMTTHGSDIGIECVVRSCVRLARLMVRVWYGSDFSCLPVCDGGRARS